MEAITKRQQEILDYIKQYRAANALSPTFREIAERFGVSVSTVYYIVQRLEVKKMIIRQPHKARFLHIPTD